MNKVFLLGNLTKDIEVKQTNNGISYARFAIAVNREYNNANGERETDFFNCIAWRSQAENIGNVCKKGSKILLTGTLQNRQYQDVQGNNHITTEILTEKWELMPTAVKAQDNSYSPQPHPTYEPPRKQTQSSGLTPVDDDDLPF